MTSFRFAVQATKARSAAEWRDLARKVEAAGFATLFLADHYLGKGPVSREASQPPQHLAPVAAMATAAAVTGTLRVGCRVFCADYHVPAVLVKEAVTIDLLSDGRLEFGIGAGWSEPEYRAIGLPFEAGNRRVAKLAEVVALFKAHCTGEELAHKGEFVTAYGYAGLPLPARRPRPPIMIGGARERVLSLAAREADVVSISNVPFTPDAHEEAVRRLGFVREAAGERFAELEIESSPFFTEVTGDPEAALERVAGMVRVAPGELRDHPNVLIGPAEEIVDRLEERRQTHGVNYVTVPQSQVDDFAPVVERLTGR
ncbi:TIGR03621 family F420-dependent LLM class oxidoreductase [Amycolatopsis sp. K13G38]|uniref:TIGR03621 family F420-dependent LLM class oxidoreductase n=1 Tax=Amycolatopsis acididurans TaxID=2724524 RepID=A0ABX1IZM1_9PSEU|nr:TIGR03621 family F420-dependent LLM class oxidoreductase [Amycolatopsis acididurans]NKQ51487.1 TIGR03621 family F420-dependent LLM class oxidoreductase [Amycolatopsis acididurans]